MVEENLRRIKNRTRDELLFADSCVGKDFGVPIIVTYHPHLNGLNKANQTSRLAFIPAPFVKSFNLSFTLFNVQLVNNSAILLAARLAEMLNNAMSFPVIRLREFLKSITTLQQ